MVTNPQGTKPPEAAASQTAAQSDAPQQTEAQQASPQQTGPQQTGPSAVSPETMKWLAIGGAVAVVVLLAVLFREQWLPEANKLLGSIDKADKAAEESSHDHAEHDHGHEGHDESSSLELSPQARKNVGLTTGEIILQPYVRTIAMPAVVIGRPGRSHIAVTAPLGGRVTRVYPIEGEAILPGQNRCSTCV